MHGSGAPARLLVVQNDPTDPVALLGEWWAELGIEMDVVRADQGEAVPSTLPEQYDGLVLLGGEMAAWEDERAPWLPDERALIVHAVEDDKPVLGVCLGGQLMTLACGGTVGRAPVAEVGVYEIDLLPTAADDPVFSALVDRAPVAQYHQDAMLEAPAGAVVLASTEGCPIQAWRLGHRQWAVQFHPEVDEDILGSWFGDDPEPLEKCGTTPDAVMAVLHARGQEMRDAWRPFAHAFGDVVRGARV